MTRNTTIAIGTALMAIVLVALSLSDKSGNGEPEEKKILYWVAPMDANYRRDKPGKSPMGMDLVPVYEGEEDGGEDTAVRINPGMINNLGVRVASVEARDLVREIETVGFISFDETHLSHVHMRSEGWVEDLAVESEGKRVRKGELLFRFYSPTFVNAQAEYFQALKSGRQNMIDASQERLRALEFSQTQIERLKRTGKAERLLDVLARQDGYVANLKAAEGMFLKPGTNALSIVDLSTVWVLADVFEDQAGWVKVGQPAKITTSYQPGIEYNGVVDYVYPVIDPKTRTLKVRFVFANENEELKPNMYAEVVVDAEGSKSATVLPREALIRTGNSDRVILSLGDGRFRPQEVTVGLAGRDEVEILKGVKPGDEVVVSGQFLIDSEASLTASFARMEPSEDVSQEGNEPAPPSAPVFGVGVINAVMIDENRINVTHEPMPDIGWPTMTMDFEVTNKVDLSKLAEGQKIHFGIVLNEKNIYVVDVLHVMSGKDGE